MCRYYIILILASFFETNGCLTSLQPLSNSKSIIVDNRVVGTWNNQDQQIGIERLSNHRIFDSLKADAKSLFLQDSTFFLKHYIISWKENAYEYIWLAALTKIDANIYVSLLPIDFQDEKGQSVYPPVDSKVKFLNTYSFAKLSWKGENILSLDFLNGDRLRKMALTGHIRIHNEYDSFYNNFLITASSEELQQFLRKYGNDPELFDKENALLLKRNSKLHVSK